jgi:two-component system, chemotaxis family, protein-glutamate methylesterase/glutaminase
MARNKVLLVIGTSAGGNSALPELIQQLTPEMGLCVFVAIHLSKTSIGEMLVQRLQKVTTLKCKIPENDETILDNHIYFAAPDHHLIIRRDKILLGRGPMENRYRPSIDALFRSAAVAYGPRVIGVVLTGMLEDGTSGMYAIKKCGGHCIVQDPGEARYPDMPKAVLKVLKPNYLLPVAKMGAAIEGSIQILHKKKRARIPLDLIREAQIAERVNIGIEAVEDLGKLSKISCPDCGGSLWEINDKGHSHYRCHVGHAFSEEGLINSMEVSTEASLWMALRMLEERKSLLRKIGEKELKKSNSNLAASYLQRSVEIEAHARKLKEILFSVSIHTDQAVKKNQPTLKTDSRNILK